MNFGKKVVSASLAVLTSVSMLGGAGIVNVAVGATSVELQAQINLLLAQLQALQTTTTVSCTAPIQPLTVGSTGGGVTAFQNWLVTNGYGSFTPTGYFGPLTQAAVARFQVAAGITPAVGYYGPITMAAVQARCTTATTTTTTTTTTGTGTTTTTSSNTLQGGAGSITVDDSSEFSSEEVGEGEEDVEVLQFSIEADEDSDVEITSIKVEFEQLTAADSEDLNDYVESVSIWLNGKMVGEADADDFSENSDVWTKSISLDDAVVDAGETEDFVVAITALNNLDSGDIDSDAWTVDVLNVRFMDAEGVTTTEDTDADGLEQTFDFESFAGANDVELTVALNDADDDINEGHVIDVDDADDTDNVEILSFTMEADGSDIMVTELPITITTTGEGDEAVIVIDATLWWGDDELATEDVPTGGAVIFQDLEIDISEGDKEEFKISVKLQDTNGALDDGDTVQAQITTTNVDAIEAEDESGEDLATGDLEGSALGEAHSTYDTGIMVEFVSKTEARTFVADDAGEFDQGTFTITFDVTAFDADQRIDFSCEEGGADAAGQGVEYTITNSASNSTVCAVSSNTVDTEDTANTKEVDDDTTRRFILSVTATSAADAYAEVALDSINYGIATDNSNANYYTFNLGDYKTEQVFLNTF